MITDHLETLDDYMSYVRDRSPGEPEFLQSVQDVAAHVLPIVAGDPKLREGAILERMVEPDRVIMFRVAWDDDQGRLRVNRGYRVQFNGAIGPYKGGLRFHPTVNLSVMKFLAFEQTFKNALTGLPMGGGKGGSDFDPRGCSDREIKRFCTAFMTELHRHIGPDVDVPAGDINVGAREIGYLFGAYRRITNGFDGSLTGKGLTFGGSELRTEATGWGLVDFTCRMLHQAGHSLDGRTVVISGAGNVATHAAEKLLEHGAKVITLSDSRGFILDREGLTAEKLAWVRDHKSRPGATLEGYANEFGAEWHAGHKPWSVKCDVALPCATQNEMDTNDVKTLIGNGCIAIGEGANMPLTSAAVEYALEAGLLVAPAKAANAGGVAVSGLEISQNQSRLPETRDVVAKQLRDIMCRIHDRCVAEADGEKGPINYVRGANRVGFRKVAEAMLAQGY